MKDTLFKGCGTALVTPFRSDGRIDYEAYAALVHRQAVEGADFLVCTATTGETPALSRREKKRLVTIARESAEGLPIMCGVGSNNVPDTLANIKALEPLSPDALLVVVPFYNKPTQEGQYLYFKEIAAHTHRPVVIYNVPGRTGANMLPDTALRIAADCPNVIGIKEASGNFGQVCELLAKAPDCFTVLSGDDDLTLAMMEKGAHGVISVASNIAPHLVHEMVQAAAEGDFAAAKALDDRLQPLYKACFVESNPIPAKAALSLLGLCSDTVRLPLSKPSVQTVELMKTVLKELQL